MRNGEKQDLTPVVVITPVVVMKFGGTSVGDADAVRRLVGHVDAARRRDPGVLVVVSALSGVTDRLLALASAAACGDTALVASGLDDLRKRHVEVARAVAPGRAAELDALIDHHVDTLLAVLRAIATLRDASPRALDTIAAAGELVSSRIVQAALTDGGIPAVWVDARRVLVTDDHFTQAVPFVAETAAAADSELRPLLAAGQVPVVGGFIGATRDGVTTTLGRGGSDYSAAILGAALRAREIQIWTDVDGLMTADPRVVPAPRVVPRLSFDEASELAYFGAKVLHPSTILPAVALDIPVRILNSRKADAAGTLITATGSGGGAPAAIACKRRVTVVDITSTRMLMACGFMRQLFEVFERHRTSVDVVTTSEVSVSVTVDDDRRLDAVVEDVEAFADVRVERGLAILCAVGDGLRQDPHLAVRMLGALDGIPLRMVSQAASRRNLTVVLRDADVAAAMTRLHEAFLEKGGSPLFSQIVKR
jgi:aspartate kinase